MIRCEQDKCNCVILVLGLFTCMALPFASDNKALSFLFLHVVILLLRDRELLNEQKDGELVHAPDLRPQHGRAVGQPGSRNSSCWIPAEWQQLSGCRGQEEALPSQVRPGSINIPVAIATEKLHASHHLHISQERVAAKCLNKRRKWKLSYELIHVQSCCLFCIFCLTSCCHTKPVALINYL